MIYQLYDDPMYPVPITRLKPGHEGMIAEVEHYRNPDESVIHLSPGYFSAHPEQSYPVAVSDVCLGHCDDQQLKELSKLGYLLGELLELRHWDREYRNMVDSLPEYRAQLASVNVQ